MTKHLRHLVYLAGFIISLHLALPAYVSSSFLAATIGFGNTEQIVSLVFVIASIVALLSIALADRPIRRFGLRRTTLGLSVITAICGLLLAFINNPLVAVVLFILFYTGGIVIKFLLDIYLEDLSVNNITGQIRGLFLTTTNVAWLFAPLMASRLIDEIYFERIYLAAALLLLPFIYFIALPLKNVIEPKYEHVNLTDGLKLLWCRDGLCPGPVRHVLMLNFTLNLFYAFMVIYLPLYLTSIRGLSWQDIGIVFTFMLLPFTLFQYFFGWLADKYFGEKEIMSLGLVIMAVTTGAMAFIGTSSLIVWSIILFINRTGACALEAMSESYFFKQVSAKNINTISFFRNVGPLSFILMPILASIILTLSSYSLLFIVIALLCLHALRYSLTLVDTK